LTVYVAIELLAVLAVVAVTMVAILLARTLAAQAAVQLQRLLLATAVVAVRSTMTATLSMMLLQHIRTSLQQWRFLSQQKVALWFQVQKVPATIQL